MFWIHKDEIFEYLAKGRKNNKVQFKDPIVLPANIFCVTNVKNKMFFKASKKTFYIVVGNHQRKQIQIFKI